MTEASKIFTVMTARDLKNSTGAVVRALRRGQGIVLTFRGRPVGTIEPVRPERSHPVSVPAYEEAWAGIERELECSPPQFASWRDAEDASRGRR